MKKLVKILAASLIVGSCFTAMVMPANAACTEWVHIGDPKNSYCEVGGGWCDILKPKEVSRFATQEQRQVCNEGNLIINKYRYVTLKIGCCPK